MHEQVNFMQISSNHFKSRHVRTCQNMDMSKFSKRCLQRTDAALQVSVWDVWGCQSVFAKNHRTDAPWGWSLFANGRLEQWWRTSKLCWNVNSSNFAFDSSSFESALNYVCILHGTIVFDIFFINPNTKPLFIFLPFPHGHIVLTGGSRPWAPHHRRHHPKTPGGGPASPSSCRARSAHRHESPGHASVHEQPGCPPVEAGEAEWGWAEVFGWREVTFLEDASHFWFDQGLRPAFSSCFPVLLKRCDKWFIYAIIYHRCRVFCLYMYLLLFPTPPDHVPTLGKISWKYSIVTLYHTLKRVHQTWRIFKIHYTSKELRRFWSHQQDSVANRIQWRPTK